MLSRTSDIYNLKIANRLKTSPFFRLAFCIMEIWKPIKDFPDYFISDYGNVKSLKKYSEIILKQNNDGRGYLTVALYLDKKMHRKKVHQLVAIAFLNHIPCGMEKVVDHKDLNKLNNNASNLRIITNRENCNRKHLKSGSKYTGVYWCKASKKWRATIKINGKNKYLGVYDDEIEASNAYEKELLKINNPASLSQVIERVF